MDNKAPDAFRTISEVADELDLPQHVLRFWESRFRDIKPMKRGGGRRYYRPQDIDLLRGIKHLLYGEGYTIRGVQRILREQSVGFVQAVWQEGAPQPPHGGDTADVDAEETDDHAADTDIDVAAEPRGIRERLSSLIGRDLGDRGDDAAARREPPLQSAPVPRVDPGDRFVPAVDFDDSDSEPPMAAANPEPRHDPRVQPRLDTGYQAPAPRPPQPQAVSVAPAAGLPHDTLRQLREALHDLTECRKLIDSAMTREA